MNSTTNIPYYSIIERQTRLCSKKVYKLQLEKEILVQAADLIKKEPGINTSSITNKEKAQVIDAGTMSRKRELKPRESVIVLSYF